MKMMKRKVEESTNDAEDRKGRCTFYNEKKRRFCRQLISPRVPEPFASESNFKACFCGNHGSMYSNLLKDRKRLKVLHDDSGKGKRIPCPIDPSHMIYEVNLKKHILKCPKAKIAAEERNLKYYKHEINTGGCGENDFNPEKKGTIDPEIFAVRVLNAYKNIFLEAGEDIDVTTLAEADMYKGIPEQNHFAGEEKSGLESSITSHRIKIGGLKHMQQIGSLVGHARSNKLFEETDTVLEMGAGRATTGFVMAGVCAANQEKKVKLLLVERSGSRSKADSALRRLQSEAKEGRSNMETSKSEYLNAEDVDVHRIKCDLANVCLSSALEMNAKDEALKVEEEKKQNILVIAKHLCGAGTDLALKAVYPIRHRINGYVMATCCHGVCSWETYVGRNFLGRIMCESDADDLHFGKEEFNLMKRWACGTVIGDKNSSEHAPVNSDVDKSKEIETDQKKREADDTVEMSVSRVSSSLGLKCGPIGLGRACQRLIDFGRCEYMRQMLFGGKNGQVDMCHYVHPDVTPQNALLLGKCTLIK